MLEKPSPEKVFISTSTEAPIAFQVTSIGKEEHEVFTHTARTVLETLEMKYLTESVIYILREFYSNAEKANIKRAHFRARALEISKPDDYARGMETFAGDLRKRRAEYNDRLLNMGLWVKVIFLVRQRNLHLIVRNNCLATPSEVKRIRERINSARSVLELMQVYNHAKDNSEGAGLGILMVLLMVRNMGVSENACRYTFDEKTGETTTQLSIPLDTVPQETQETVTKRIADAVGDIPPFPENIHKLQEMLREGRASFTKVGALIQNDPAMTAALLKIVNSSQYMLPKKLSNISAACTLLGLNGLRGLLASYGVTKVMTERYGNMGDLWEHASLSASFAYHLARLLGLPDLADAAHVGGLLHDIGKIILLETHPDLAKGINEYSTRQGMGGNLFERLALGASHARIGALVAQRWNFPDEICAAIEFHHRPLLAPAEHRQVCDLVHLANLFCHRMLGELDYFTVEDPVLERNRIEGRDGFNALGKQLEDIYEKQREKERG